MEIIAALSKQPPADFFSLVSAIKRDPSVTVIYSMVLDMCVSPKMVADIAYDSNRHVFVLTTTFLSFLGQSGCLPIAFSARTRAERSVKQTAFLDLLNLYYQRIVDQFYALQSLKFDVYHWAPEQMRLTDTDTLNLLRTATRLHHSSETSVTAEMTWLALAGRLSIGARNAETLKVCLSAYSGWPCDIETHAGEWSAIETDSRCYLGLKKTVVLGQNSVLGSHIYHAAHALIIHLGPLTYSEYCQRLPDTTAPKSWCRFVARYLGPAYHFRLQTRLHSHTLPRLQLSYDLKQTCRLGWTTFLGRPKQVVVEGYGYTNRKSKRES